MSAVVYQMSRGYRRTVAWLGDPKTQERRVVMTHTPNRGTPRRERYHSGVQFLRSLGVNRFPEYQPTKGES
jgi:hypothetical protein